MKKYHGKEIAELIGRYPVLSACEKELTEAAQAWIDTYRLGGKILLCGNGGSAADCDHIVGELMKGFCRRRPLGKDLADTLAQIDGAPAAEELQSALPAVSLPSQTALVSAYCNDMAAENVYAQSVLGLAKKEDLLVCLSTSGNSKNCVRAAAVAKALGVRTCALTGEKESRLSSLCDVTVRVPDTETYRIQELHLPVYHALCLAVENTFFTE